MAPVLGRSLASASLASLSPSTFAFRNTHGKVIHSNRLAVRCDAAIAEQEAPETEGEKFEYQAEREPPQRRKMKSLKAEVEGEERGETKERRRNEGMMNGAWHMWHNNGTRCPKGSVPIRRSIVHDVLRA
ncbi:hypothetical protein Ancab_033171 [Ancistrocladus abbreviatus]